MNTRIIYPAIDPVALKNTLVTRLFGSPNAVVMEESEFHHCGKATRKMANSGRELNIDVRMDFPGSLGEDEISSHIAWVGIGVSVTAERTSATHEQAVSFIKEFAQATGGFIEVHISSIDDYTWETPSEIVALNGLHKKMAELMLRFGPEHAEAFAKIIAQGFDVVPIEG